MDEDKENIPAMGVEVKEEIANSESATTPVEQPIDVSAGKMGAGAKTNNDDKEIIRSTIAMRFIIGFFLIVFLVFVSGWSLIISPANFKDLLLTIIGTLSSSLGFIIGYYFKISDSKN